MLTNILLGICIVMVIILVIAMFATTNHHDARTTHMEYYLKEYAEDSKKIKNMLRAEIPETAQAEYAKFMKKHLPFKSYDDMVAEQEKK